VSPMTEYDDVAYPSLPLPQTQPDRMATQARLHGVRAPDPASARVLEIGCSDAGNLAWLAAHTPDGRFVGIDLSERAVARAQTVISGLPNVEVRQGDLRTLRAGTFDFVIAHGVYSWLDRPADLLDCIDRHLAADGIAYVSYNAMPGSHVRRMAGDVLRRFAAGHGDQVAAARSLADWIGQSSIESAHAEMMRWAMHRATAKPDHVLVHDEMAPANRAVFFDELVAEAAACGLAYLGESHLADSSPPPGVEVPAWLAAQVGPDEVARQQVLDYARNRAFRQTLLVRAQNAPEDHGIDPEGLDALWAATPVRRIDAADGPPTWQVGDDVTVAGADPGLAADLERLGGAWPGSVAVADLGMDRRLLADLHAARGVELRAHPVPAVMPGVRPRVHPHVRARAALEPVVANWRHEPIRLDDPRARTAVALCDGRTSRAQIAAALATDTGLGDAGRFLDALLAELGAAGLFLG